jgi:hypothetical protein
LENGVVASAGSVKFSAQFLNNGISTLVEWTISLGIGYFKSDWMAQQRTLVRVSPQGRTGKEGVNREDEGRPESGGHRRGKRRFTTNTNPKNL